MNVAFDPWIPVVTTTGERKLASLCAVLAEGEKFADLSVRPHERVALMRLFLCVAHAALEGPKNYDEWCDVPQRLPDAVQKYLSNWKASFELFHDTKPWLQVAGLKPAKENDEKAFTPLAKLDFALASGAASTIFDHMGNDNTNRAFDYSQVVLGLISMQNFSTCGLLSRPLWNGKACPNSAKDAPCITSSMYHVFLIGKSLFDTICINICDYDELALLMKDSNPEGDWLGQPVWEQMPISDTDDQLTRTYLGRLVPVSRAILLRQGKLNMLYGEALRYPTYPDFPQESNCSVAIRHIKKKDERYLVGDRLGIQPWRQLDSIIQFNMPSKSSSHAINLGHLDKQALDIWVGALLRNPGKQDIIDTVESRFHISKQLRSTEGCSSYSKEVEKAQNVSNLLDTAIYIYRIEVDSRNETGIGTNARNCYWTTVENNLTLLLTHIKAIGSEDAIPTRKEWRKMLFSSACEAYRIACGQETPRQMRAFAKGLQKLTGEKDEHEPNNNKHDKEEKHELAS